MSRELEEQLGKVPERWRDATRTRAYAVMDFLAAGQDGSLIVEVLSRRTGLTTSAFYALVRRWKASGGDPASLAPWARRPDSKPRIPADVTAEIDARAAPLIAADPGCPTEPVAQGILKAWPDGLPRPGISYVRRRVNHVRSEHEKKTRRARRQDDDDGSDIVPKPRWPLDVIVIDHVAVEAVVWIDDEPTLPIATLAIDVATGNPVAVATSLDAPSPREVAIAVANLGVAARRNGAPGPPTVVVATTAGVEWQALIAAMAGAGVTLIVRRSRRLSFGSDANLLLNGRLGGYRLAPRLGHRPRNGRTTPRSVLSLPNRDMADFAEQVGSLVAEQRDKVMAEHNWPAAATAEPEFWSNLAAAVADRPIAAEPEGSEPAPSATYGKC